mgnify:FL=1
MGRLSGIIDLGIYLYDPIKNSYPHTNSRHGIFYSYNINNEDGWNYIRLAIRYKIHKKLALQGGIKLHRNVAEMLEFGVGYLLPIYK